MASNNFRDSLNSLGWSRRDEPVNTSSNTPILGRLQSLNPFGQGGYVRLPTTENSNPGAPLPAPSRREEEEGWFARTYTIPLFLLRGLSWDKSNRPALGQHDQLPIRFLSTCFAALDMSSCIPR